MGLPLAHGALATHCGVGRLQADYTRQLNGVSSNILMWLASGLSEHVLRSSEAWWVMFRRTLRLSWARWGVAAMRKKLLLDIKKLGSRGVTFYFIFTMVSSYQSRAWRCNPAWGKAMWREVMVSDYSWEPLPLLGATGCLSLLPLKFRLLRRRAQRHTVPVKYLDTHTHSRVFLYFFSTL